MDFLLLKLGDHIQGESTIEGYTGQIEILSFSHGISQEIVHGLTGRTGTVGPKHQDFTLSRYLDLASTGILDACDRGTLIQQATFTAGQTDNGKVNPYWVITMKDVIVTSVSWGGGGGSRPTESITLNYTAISWLYTLQTGSSGTPVTNSASWDLTTNKEGP